MKKTANQTKKKKKNKQKSLEKIKKKAQANNIRRLAIFNTNRQAEIRLYQAIYLILLLKIKNLLIL